MGELDEAIRGVNDMRAVGEQLTGFDAATWRTSTSDRNARSVIIGLLGLETRPDWDRFRARFERLTRMVPVLRERPLFGNFRLSAPRLAVDPDFDLDIHLHHMRVPEGGDWSDVLNEARRMSLTDFDHDRPLWEAALIEGLPDGKAAMIIKLHHAIGDGQATVMMGAHLFELTADGNPDEPDAPPPPKGKHVPVASVSGANIYDNVGRAVGMAATGAKVAADLAKGTLKDPVGTWTDAVNMVGSFGRLAAIPESQLSPLMTERSTTYRFATFDIPFQRIRAASKGHNHTVNDVFLAAVSTGMAIYHDRHGLPTRELRFNLPISLRSASKDGSAANAVTIARFALPINGVSVAERLRASHDQVKRWRDEPALALTEPVADVSWMVPVPVLAGTMRTSDITTSNVPGPPMPLYLSGAKMIGMWPLVATIGAAANVTMVTYDGVAYIGVSADDDSVPDIDNLREDLIAGFEEVMNDVSESAAGSGSSWASDASKPRSKRAATKKAAKSAVKKAAATGKSARKVVRETRSTVETSAKTTVDAAAEVAGKAESAVKASKPAPKKATAKKATAKKATAKKATAKKATAKKATAKKATAKKATAKPKS